LAVLIGNGALVLKAKHAQIIPVFPTQTASSVMAKAFGVRGLENINNNAHLVLMCMRTPQAVILIQAHMGIV